VDEEAEPCSASLVEFSAQDLRLLASLLRIVPAAFEPWELSIVIGTSAEELVALAVQLEAIVDEHWTDSGLEGWSTDRVRAVQIGWERWSERDDDSLARWFSVENALLALFSAATSHAASPEPALMNPLPELDALDGLVLKLMAKRLRRLTTTG